MRLGATVVGLTATFVVLALPFVDQPIDTWEWQNLCAGEQIARSGIPSLDYPAARHSTGSPTLLLIHPPSSAYLIGLSLRLFGPGEWQARLPGLVVVVMTAGLLAWLVHRHGTRQSGHAQVGLVMGLYLIHPATLHGALYLSFSEGTLLPLTWVLFVLVWLETVERRMAVRIAALAPCFALALWAKIATSLALPVLAALVVLLVDGVAPAVAALVGISVLGGGLFAASWAAYLGWVAAQTGVQASALWAEPFRYLGGEARVFSGEGLALNATRTVFYLGPLLVATGSVAIVRRVAQYARERRATPADLVPLLVVAVAAVYLVLPGGTGSFPKYHFVILPLLAWLAARELGGLSRPSPHRLVLLGLGALAWAVFVVRDPLTLLNHELRTAALTGGTTPVAARLGLAVALYALLPAALAGLLLRWRPAVTVAILASQLGLILVQAQGGYFTKHLYGTSLADVTGTIAVLRVSTPPESAIVALPEFGYTAGRRVLGGLSRQHWRDPEALEALIREGRPAAVVYGLPTHTVWQVRAFASNARLVATLARDYRRADVGEFIVWLRR